MQTIQQISRINDVLYFIHQDISNELLAKELAGIAAYSEQHFHRLFKTIVGEPVHHYIRRIRMEFAANQLMFDTKSSVVDIAIKSGFFSVSSFSRAFKSTFNVSPGQWRNNEHQHQNKPFLANKEIAACYQRLYAMPTPKCQLVQLPKHHVAYVRHQGYDRSIENAWQVLKTWANNQGRDFSQQFGLHHSNPALVELKKCRYVACVTIDYPILQRGLVNSMTIPGGLHAVFKLQGVYGELLPQLSKIIEHWLPTSGYKMLSTPAYVHYRKNQFLSENEQFELDFCLPISPFN
jgi:AraC family transcriptional regulator